METPVPPLGRVAAAQNRDYTAFYNDDAHDGAGGNYANMMRTFEVPMQGALPPQSIATAVYQSATIDPQAFLLLVTGPDQPEGRVMVFHRLQRFEPQLGVPTPFDGQGFAFVGDIVRGQAPPSILWEATCFHQVNGGGVRVPTKALIDQALADPTVTVFDAPDPADAATEVVRVRNTVLLPFRYVKLLLADPLSPRAAWERVAGAITNDGNEMACAPVMDWLQVALVREPGAPASRLGRPLPTVPLMLPALMERRWGLVTRDLPALGAGATLAAGNAIAVELNNLVADNRASRQAEQAARLADKEKTPTKYFGAVGVAKLLRLCQVADEAALPAVWRDLASSPKKQDILVLQQAFNSMAQDQLSLPGSDVPITPDITSKLRNLSFEMTNEEDLSTGIHCFTFGYQSAVERAAAYELVERYQLMQQGQGAPSLAEAAAFNHSAVSGKLPQTLTESSICFNNTRVALHVLLSSAHPMVVAYDTFWRAWGSSQAHLLHVRPRSQISLPALAVRWVQLRLSLWFAQQATTSANVDPPEFTRLLRDIRLQAAWEPTLPSQYYEASVPPVIGPGRAPSSPTAINVAVSGTGSTEARSSPERNPHLNPAYAGYGALPVRITEVLARAGAANRPPRASGSEACLSFHVKGICNSDCRRRADHRTYTEAEDAALLAWCQRWYTEAPAS